MIILFVSLLTSFVVCGLLIRYQNWHLTFSGDHDLGGPQKFHQFVAPRIGGIGIAIGYLAVLLVYSFLNFSVAKSMSLIALAALPIFAVGVVEDLTKRIGIKIRLTAAVISGALFLFFFEIYSIHLDIPIIDPLLTYPVVSIPFLIFAIAGHSNAYNIIDGFNGLASMVGIIASTAILYVAFKVQDPLVTSLGLVIIGSSLGFFIQNYPKGLIFLGDGGAYLVGFLIALTSILLVNRNPSVSPWFALIVNAYPIFETLFTIWRRTFHQGRNPGLPDAVHFHSLIYRRIIRWEFQDYKCSQHLHNSKTSPYLWVISSLGAIPAMLFWNSTLLLMISGIMFVLLYIYAYRLIVTFKIQTILKKIVFFQNN